MSLPHNLLIKVIILSQHIGTQVCTLIMPAAKTLPNNQHYKTSLNYGPQWLLGYLYCYVNDNDIDNVMVTLRTCNTGDR